MKDQPLFCFLFFFKLKLDITCTEENLSKTRRHSVEGWTGTNCSGVMQPTMGHAIIRIPIDVFVLMTFL